jgi:spore coat polysaccharide biosynthesis predicted glycosyltransferase SpsG
MEAAIVVASDSPHLPQMLDAARKSDNIRLHDNVTDMPALMAWADAAITAGGSTCWETAFMGLPSLIVVVAANQTGVAGGLQSFGSAVNLGWHEGLTAIEIAAALDSLLQNADQRRWMGDAGRRLVNGQGARNAVAAIRELL